MNLYEYVVYFVPTEKQLKNGQKPEIIQNDMILARDEKEANMIIGRELPFEWFERISELTIETRLF